MENAKSKLKHKNFESNFIKELIYKIKNNSASNTFFVNNNEDSLNLNDNIEENYTKSIMSSDSIIDEIAKHKKVKEKDFIKKDELNNSSNMFNDDSINKALRENIMFIDNDKLKMDNYEKNKNNKFTGVMNCNANIPVLNVESAMCNENKFNSKSKYLIFIFD